MKKAVTVFNDLLTDLRSLSIQYENKINGLCALFVALERVNMRYMEKMKHRNSNPQTAKQQLKSRLQICKNMREVLKNTKKYEDVLTDKQKKLLPNSCNINPLKPRSENLTKLTNPYFEKPPIKKSPIPNLLKKCRSTLEIKNDKFPEMSSSSQTTTASGVIPPQTQDTVQTSSEDSKSTTTSAKLKRLHPWCKLTRLEEELKQKTSKETAKLSKQLKTSKAPIPNLLRKYRSTLKINKNKLYKLRKAKLSSMLSSSATTSSSQGILPQSQGLVQSSNEDSKSTATSTELKRLHPWYKSTRTVEEINSKTTENRTENKQQNNIESTNPSKRIPISSKSTKVEYSEDSEANIPGKENIKIETNQKIEEIVTKEKVTEQKGVKEAKDNGLFLSSTHKNILQHKRKIKYTERKNYCPDINKKEVLSIVQYEEAYPWGKEAAQNREKESPLSDKIIKLSQKADKILPSIMKYELYYRITYPENINKKINDKIQKEGDKYICINCKSNSVFSTNRRCTLEKHVKSELGYFTFRCSFCDVKSNDPRTLIKHYASTHGVPTKWLESD